MSKELEALNKIQHDFGQLKGQELVNCYELIFNGLKRLEAIDNANPSEALKWLEHTGEQWVEYGLNDDVVQYKETQSYREIKQALLKAQEDEKLKVDICEMFGLDNLFPYNDKKAYLKELEEYMGRKNQL